MRDNIRKTKNVFVKVGQRKAIGYFLQCALATSRPVLWYVKNILLSAWLFARTVFRNLYHFFLLVILIACSFFAALFGYKPRELAEFMNSPVFNLRSSKPSKPQTEQ